MNNPLSPLDDRYYDEVKGLAQLFSERSLFYHRLVVESYYLAELCDKGIIKEGCQDYNPETVLRNLKENWYEEIKNAEKATGHDVKATELFLRKHLLSLGYKKLAPLVHLALTSEDVNANAYGIMLEKGKNEILKCYISLILKISEISRAHAEKVILGRTHGVPAVPTTFGKELSYFAVRLLDVSEKIMSIKPYGKLSGAVGSFNSFYFINNNVDWIKFSNNFIKRIGLEPPKITKQNPLWDNTARILQEITLANSIMKEMAQDLWLYNSLGIIRFKRKGVGSSTMPHKVNPVELEDAEGQCEVSNSILNALIFEPLASRLQRDLSDSAVRRNVGVAFAHSYLACKRLLRALDSFEFVGEDVDSHIETLSEPLQIAFKLAGDLRAYERVFENIEYIKELSSELPEKLRERFKSLKPSTYMGLSKKLALDVSEEVEKRAKEILKELNGD
ncbi:MAG: lyase family protein [Nitrososphaeria archaeon]